jgi:TolA-binding protein
MSARPGSTRPGSAGGRRSTLRLRIAVFGAIAACAIALLPRTVHAQDGSLERVQELITTGRFTEADNTLLQWERSIADARSAAAPADRARAAYLRALLTTDAGAAQDMFVRIALSYPSSAVAPEALLRLGQLLLTTGETRRATAYLERLRTDYPGAPARERGLLWLARAQIAAGRANVACRTATDGLRDTADPELQRLLEIERARSCGRS